MTTNQTIDGVPRDDLELVLLHGHSTHESDQAWDRLRALLDAPEDNRTETVPKHKFDTLVQHCKRLDGEIAQARAHVNEITLYQQNAVWFWQHDGEDFLESLSCPIIIQPHHLRELLKGAVPAAQPQGEPVACAHEWTDDGEFTLTCTKCGKTENHEPYGWVQTRGNAINHFTQEWDVVESWEDQGFEYKAMFDHAEQPAPVAVVLPERKQHVHQGLSHTDPRLMAGTPASTK
ncbi:hypothetical protein [Pseudomonas fluorescens]|uniref:hypothetical protein n=1 Tax=Pseudomonas fluorescens TaxID=294 RepID=UPI0005C6C128|nr:hypothetical protein [Pseudomonas fluorescens]